LPQDLQIDEILAMARIGFHPAIEGGARGGIDSGLVEAPDPRRCLFDRLPVPHHG
jgi:hypothetical protein